MMTATLKICLKPTKEQEVKMFEACNTARFVYNWALNTKIKSYEVFSENLEVQDLISRLQDLKAMDEYSWINNVAECVTKQAIKDLINAYKNFFKRGNTGFPKFKKKGRCADSFYQRTDKIYLRDGKVNITNIGKIKVSKNSSKWFPSKPLNPRIKYDGKNWYLTVSYALDKLTDVELTNNVIGIDLGVKTLATCSNGKAYRGTKYDTKIKKYEKKLKHLQRLVSKKYEKNKELNNQCERFNKSKNIIKLEKKIKLLYRKIANVRDNYNHTMTIEIVKTKPSKIVVEDLNVAGMLKNIHLAKAVQNQCFHTILNYLEYKCKYFGIEFVKADRWYASSKICSCCGNKKKELKLSERTYVCEKCGLVIDRDLNASKNLASYIN